MLIKLDHILSARETTEEASMEMAVAEIAARDAVIRKEERERAVDAFKDVYFAGERNARTLVMAIRAREPGPGGEYAI